jgi:hypothetical protein
MDAPRPAHDPEFLVNKTRVRVLGLSFDDAVKIFFGGNAFISVLVLTLITYFLFQEGFGFFGQNHRSLLTYRQAGLEYVDFIRTQVSGHTALTRYVSDLRLRQFNELTTVRKLDLLLIESCSRKSRALSRPSTSRFCWSVRRDSKIFSYMPSVLADCSAMSFALSAARSKCLVSANAMIY